MTTTPSPSPPPIHRSSFIIHRFALLCLFCAAAAPSTRPAEIRLAFASLADADASVRDKARDQLMSLSRDDLPALCAVVRDALPLQPAQLAALKDIVPHIYLTSEKYAQAPEGFLGVRMSINADPASPPQIIIDARFPGFAGYRYLQDGDIILDIDEMPLARPLRQETFSQVIRQFKPRQTIHVKILRHGQTLRIPVTLDPRPALQLMDELGAMDELVNQREQAVERYWKENLAPLIQPAAEPK